MSFVLHFIHLHSVGGARVVRTERNIISCTTYRTRAVNVTCFRALSTMHLPCATERNVYLTVAYRALACSVNLSVGLCTFSQVYAFRKIANV